MIKYSLYLITFILFLKHVTRIKNIQNHYGVVFGLQSCHKCKSFNVDKIEKFYN